MSTISKQLFSGVFYTAIAKYSSVLIALVVSGILGRLLSPEDFGVVAISTVIITFFSMFSNMGISAAIIQNKELAKEDLSSIFSFTIWLGIILSGVFFLLSGLVAEYYKDGALVSICRILSVQLFFVTANIVPNSLFYRDKRFKFLALRTFIVQFLSGALAVAAALSGWGYYALLVNPILSSILLFVISYRCYPLPFNIIPGFGAIRKIFGYSAYQFLFNVVNYFSNNLDKLLIGRYIGMNSLGYYEKSYRLMELPLQNLTFVIGPVMHPVFSDFQHDKLQLSVSYQKIVRFLAFAGLPLSVFLFFTAKELTLLIFGSQWMPSVFVLQILSLSVGIRVVLSSSGAIFQAANDTRSLFICGLFSAIVNVLGVLVGIFTFGSLEAIAACLCVTFLINFMQCYWQMYRITLRQPLMPFIRQFGSPLLCTVLLAVILGMVSWSLKADNMFLTLAVKGVVFLVVMMSYIQWTHEYDIFAKIKKLIFKS